ncbi:MAG: hypothetical protein U0174_13910 [Polyangiaceae bacterium]
MAVILVHCHRDRTNIASVMKAAPQPPFYLASYPDPYRHRAASTEVRRQR